MSATPAIPGSRWARRCFAAGCYVLILTAIAHLIGHFVEREPANQTERELRELMRGYWFDVGLARRTVQDFYTGFSWHYALSLAALALLGWAAARHGPGPRRSAAGVLALASAIFTVNAAMCWFLAPLLCHAAAAVLFSAAWVLEFRARRPVSLIPIRTTEDR